MAVVWLLQNGELCSKLLKVFSMHFVPIFTTFRIQGCLRCFGPSSCFKTQRVKAVPLPSVQPESILDGPISYLVWFWRCVLATYWCWLVPAFVTHFYSQNMGALFVVFERFWCVTPRGAFSGWWFQICFISVATLAQGPRRHRRLCFGRNHQPPATPMRTPVIATCLFVTVLVQTRTPTYIDFNIYIHIRQLHLNMWRAGQATRPRR